MVIGAHRQTKNSGLLMVELAVAMAMLLIAMLPLAYGFHSDANLLRATYQRAVAVEIVDGEIEILAAGDWRNFPEGLSPYPVQAKAAANLPPGQFKLTRRGNHLRLEWAPAKKSGVGTVVREVVVK
jgi:hypothetical protein